MASETTLIKYVEGAAASTPAASRVVTYAKADGLMYSKDDAGTETLMSGGAGGGSVATDAIWDAAGDLAVGSGANAAARLAIGATNGMGLARVSGAVAWVLPPGYEWDYVQKTTNTNITNTTEGTADTILTGNAVTFDGAPVMVEWWSPSVQTPGTAGAIILVILFEGATVIGYFNAPVGVAGSENYGSQGGRYRFTPTAAAHTYHVKAIVTAGTGVVGGGAGGTGAFLPTFMRITKV